MCFLQLLPVDESLAGPAAVGLDIRSAMVFGRKIRRVGFDTQGGELNREMGAGINSRRAFSLC